jgi:hypothetical protein
MSLERFPSDDPREWLNRARSNLASARGGINIPDVYLALVEQAGRTVPEQVKEAARLSDYAVEARYPGLAEPVTREEYEEAVTIATEVIHWVSNVIENRAARDHQRSEGAEG